MITRRMFNVAAVTAPLAGILPIAKPSKDDLPDVLDLWDSGIRRRTAGRIDICLSGLPLYGVQFADRAKGYVLMYGFRPNGDMVLTRRNGRLLAVLYQLHGEIEYRVSRPPIVEHGYVLMPQHTTDAAATPFRELLSKYRLNPPVHKCLESSLWPFPDLAARRLAVHNDEIPSQERARLAKIPEYHRNFAIRISTGEIVDLPDNFWKGDRA